MNQWLMPRVPSAWSAIGERETRHHVFPAGVFEFIGGRDAVLGDYQACSLFSPMFAFADPVAAHDTALASLAALFDPASREADEVVSGSALPPSAATPPTAPVVVPIAKPLSKRSFLFGQPHRAGRGP